MMCIEFLSYLANWANERASGALISASSSIIGRILFRLALTLESMKFTQFLIFPNYYLGIGLYKCILFRTFEPIRNYFQLLHGTFFYAVTR